MRVRTKLATGRVKQDEESMHAANAFTNIVDCVHRLKIPSNTSPRVPFPTIPVKTVSINLQEVFCSPPSALVLPIIRCRTKLFSSLAA